MRNQYQVTIFLQRQKIPKEDCHLQLWMKNSQQHSGVNVTGQATNMSTGTLLPKTTQSHWCY
jgi:Tfp pilus assembly major pilin PilA